MVFVCVYRPRTQPTHLLSSTNEAKGQGFLVIAHITREARDIRMGQYILLTNEAFITLREERDRSGNNIQSTSLEVQASKEKVLCKARNQGSGMRPGLWVPCDSPLLLRLGRVVGNAGKQPPSIE